MRNPTFDRNANQLDEYLSVTIFPHASQTLYTLLKAREPIRVTGIDAIPCLAEGTARTATLVKAAADADPASATTPLHTAAGINCNGTAHDTQQITLSTTSADLKLSAGDQLGLVLSAAMATGILTLSIRFRRIR